MHNSNLSLYKSNKPCTLMKPYVNNRYPISQSPRFGQLRMQEMMNGSLAAMRAFNTCSGIRVIHDFSTTVPVKWRWSFSNRVL